jgi:hypothetical protein
MLYSEIKEVTDFFVQHLINKLPRFKINSFAQEFSNALLAQSQAEPDASRDLPKNPEGYWVMRNLGYVCPLLLNVLDKTAISPAEVMMHIPELVLVKVEVGKVSLICNKDSKVINLGAFVNKPYFEIPVRVLKTAIEQRLNMLAYCHTFDLAHPNDFIPLILIALDPNSSKDVVFRAVGLPMYLFSAESLNKTTFGSHNSVQTQFVDSFSELSFAHGPCGDARLICDRLFCDSEKVDFFSPGWWERIVMSQIVVEYADRTKGNSHVYNVLNQL